MLNSFALYMFLYFNLYDKLAPLSLEKLFLTKLMQNVNLATFLSLNITI